MNRDTFSERYGYMHHGSDLIYEAAPETVRVGLREVLANCGYTQPSSQRTIICRALRRRPDPGNWSEYPNINQEVDDLIHDCEWFKFYDMCERIGQLINQDNFEDEFNRLLREERIGYEMREHKLLRIGTQHFNEAIEETRSALANAEFSIPLGQFERALAFRNSMPPDHPNAVKEAVNALEGTLQIVTEMPGTALPTLLSSLRPPLPTGLKKILDGIYSYGSASQGGRHAGVGGPVPLAEEAELIVHAVAAAIRYVTKMYPLVMLE